MDRTRVLPLVFANEKQEPSAHATFWIFFGFGVFVYVRGARGFVISRFVVCKFVAHAMATLHSPPNNLAFFLPEETLPPSGTTVAAAPRWPH